MPASVSWPFCCAQVGSTVPAPSPAAVPGLIACFCAVLMFCTSHVTHVSLTALEKLKDRLCVSPLSQWSFPRGGMPGKLVITSPASSSETAPHSQHSHRIAAVCGGKIRQVASGIPSRHMVWTFFSQLQPTSAEADESLGSAGEQSMQLLSIASLDPSPSLPWVTRDSCRPRANMVLSIPCLPH